MDTETIELLRAILEELQSLRERIDEVFPKVEVDHEPTSC